MVKNMILITNLKTKSTKNHQLNTHVNIPYTRSNLSKQSDSELLISKADSNLHHASCNTIHTYIPNVRAILLVSTHRTN